MPKYMTVLDASKQWNVSERTVRYYCFSGRVAGLIQKGGAYMIPSDCKKPSRSNEKENKNYLLERLREEKKHSISGGIYHKLQIDMAYNSNHIEGSRLSHDETRYIFETKTIGFDGKEPKVIKVDDIIETINHFAAVDRVIDFANYELSEPFIKELHEILKRNTSDSRLAYFAVGDYKKRANFVSERETTEPRLVHCEMEKLVADYNKKARHSLEDIIDFHVKFERIHPFQDGNGRVGRLIALKECLKNNVVPFIILDEHKMFYYRGLDNWDKENGYLLDTCLLGQDIIKQYLDYFKIQYK